MQKKNLILNLALMSILLNSYSVKAHEDPSDYHYIPIETTREITKPIGGVALAVSMAQHHYDINNQKWQGSIGVGTFAGNGAVSLGLAKKVKHVLINASFGIEAGESATGFGINWEF